MSAWTTRAQTLMTEYNSLGCDAGHARHNRKILPVAAPGYAGPMTCFNAVKYLNTPGYCMGDDDVSRTLALYGIWEPIETNMFVTALARSPGLVIDFGSQIGWYSMLATTSGHDVLAIEAIAEHEELTWINAGDREGRLTQIRHWVDGHTPTLDAVDVPPISCVKIDIEGAEEHALRCIKNLLDADLVPNILMEVSPVFNDSYPPLVSDLLARGYTATALNPVQPMTSDNYESILDEIPQVDVMFSK